MQTQNILASIHRPSHTSVQHDGEYIVGRTNALEASKTCALLNLPQHDIYVAKIQPRQNYETCSLASDETRLPIARPSSFSLTCWPSATHPAPAPLPPPPLPRQWIFSSSSSCWSLSEKSPGTGVIAIAPPLLKRRLYLGPSCLVLWAACDRHFLFLFCRGRG